MVLCQQTFPHFCTLRNDLQFIPALTLISCRICNCSLGLSHLWKSVFCKDNGVGLHGQFYALFFFIRTRHWGLPAAVVWEEDGRFNGREHLRLQRWILGGQRQTGLEPVPWDLLDRKGSQRLSRANTPVRNVFAKQLMKHHTQNSKH